MKMINAIGCEDLRNGEDLLGLLEYYEAILDRDGLVTREGEIRSIKLGLIVDLLRMVNIPDKLKADLVLAVIDAWAMSSKSSTQNEEDLKAVRSSIEAVRRCVLDAMAHPRSRASLQLDAAVMLSLPLMPCDLQEGEVARIRGLLGKVMDFFAADMESEFWHGSQ
jgi:hypothetical protein